MRVFVVRNVPHLRPFMFKIGPILRPPQCDFLFKLIRPFVSLPSFKQNLAVNCELKLNIKTLFESLFRMHSSNKSSNVYEYVTVYMKVDLIPVCDSNVRSKIPSRVLVPFHFTICIVWRNGHILCFKYISLIRHHHSKQLINSCIYFLQFFYTLTSPRPNLSLHRVSL